MQTKTLRRELLRAAGVCEVYKSTSQKLIDELSEVQRALTKAIDMAESYMEEEGLMEEWGNDPCN